MKISTLEKFAIISIIVAFLIIRLFISVRANSVPLSPQDEINLITIEKISHGDIISLIKLKDRSKIDPIVDSLSDSVKTFKSSVDETPSVDEYFKIFLNGTTDSVLYLYEDDDQYYIEQPYHAIYKTNNKTNAIIENMYKLNEKIYIENNNELSATSDDIFEHYTKSQQLAESIILDILLNSSSYNNIDNSTYYSLYGYLEKYANNISIEDNLQQTSNYNYTQALTQNELEDTKNLAIDYFTNQAPYYEGVEYIEPIANDSNMYKNEGIEDQYKAGNIIIYKVLTVKDKKDDFPERYISIARTSKDDEWKVINHGK